MEFCSTRNSELRISAAEAIIRGLSEDGGLFVPVNFPKIEISEMMNYAEDYRNLAFEIIGRFLTDFPPFELRRCIDSAYGKAFPTEVVPMAKIRNTVWSVELWHGPTCAFKDMALQLLPHLLTTACKITGDNTVKHILVATSGDTGKAALEGFKDVEGTKITVFYPADGVSQIQKLQMASQTGENVDVVAINGNFDDAQTAVKEAFSDEATWKNLAEQGIKFSSANSINFGRLVPQIVYYFYSYCKLLREGEIVSDEKVNIAVPTGNFGNILAAYYAKCMGLPVNKFICASNENHILTDFISTGVYNKNREFYLTNSPSMDILISSNLERLLYHLSENNDAEIRSCYSDLNEKGEFRLAPDILERLQENFVAGYANNAQTLETVRKTFDENRYLLDTHTAVCAKVTDKYIRETGDKTKTILASTANPYKFADDVLKALEPDSGKAGFEAMEHIFEITGCKIPEKLSGLKSSVSRFDRTIHPREIIRYLNR